MRDFLSEFHAKLEYFANKRVKLRQPATSEAIVAAEARLGYSLSPTLRRFLLEHNGGYVMDIVLRGVQLLGQQRIARSDDLVSRNLANWEQEWWPKNWLEIGSEAFGNYFVADLTQVDEKGEAPILFVDHEAIGQPDSFRKVADSFDTFLIYAVDQMIRLYLPDGMLRSLRK